jgi:hypothetical protein
MAPRLAERCIRLATPEAGCCGCCGAPLVRVTETEYDNPGNRTTNGPQSLARRHATIGFPVRLEKAVATTGWRRTCDCPEAPPRRAIVLDPFAGVGTTLLVASALGRDSVGVELCRDNVPKALKRLEQGWSPEKAPRRKQPPPDPAGQLSLLDLLEADS